MIQMAQKVYPWFGFAGGNAFPDAPGNLPGRVTGAEFREPAAPRAGCVSGKNRNSMGG
jgi:hypothetical protein